MPEALAKKFENLREAYLEMASSSYEPGPIFIFVEEDILRDVGDLVLQNARQRAESKGVKEIATVVLDGPAAEKIIGAAEAEKADMIVMGSRGLGHVAGLLMGSVSHKVNHLASCTCITVK